MKMGHTKAIKMNKGELIRYILGLIITGESFDLTISVSENIDDSNQYGILAVNMFESKYHGVLYPEFLLFGEYESAHRKYESIKIDNNQNVIAAELENWFLTLPTTLYITESASDVYFDE